MGLQRQSSPIPIPCRGQAHFSREHSPSCGLFISVRVGSERDGPREKSFQRDPTVSYWITRAGKCSLTPDRGCKESWRLKQAWPHKSWWLGPEGEMPTWGANGRRSGARLCSGPERTGLLCAGEARKVGGQGGCCRDPSIDATKSLVERSGVWSPGVGAGVHQLSVS